MSKLDQIRSLGAPQIGRMVERAVPEKPRVTPELRKLVTQPPKLVTRDEKLVTGRRGPKPKFVTAAERQRAYRERKKKG